MTAQWLRVLPGLFRVEHHPGEGALPDNADWLAVVRAPEGLTLITSASSEADDTWIAFYSGDTAHGLDVPGMLSALLVPLKEAGLPVFVASTYHADLVLVPDAREDDAVAALRGAGHRVDTERSVDH